MTGKKIRPFFLGVALALLWAGCGQAVVQRSETGEYFTEQFTLRKKDQVKHGPYKKYTLDGALVEEGEYANGQIQGERKKYAQGQLVSIETMQNGVFHGPYQSFYPDGKPNSVGTYENDMMVGVWKRYFPNGQLLEEVTFVNNLENGPFREFYDNGNLKAEGQYKNGDQEDGELRLYNEQGVLIRIMNCVEGVCRTTWQLEGEKQD